MRLDCTATCLGTKVRLGNFAYNTPGATNIIFQVAIEDMNSNIYPYTINGSTLIDVAPGGYVDTDANAFSAYQGTTVFIRMVMQSAGPWQTGYIFQRPGEWSQAGNYLTNGTFSSSVGYGPFPLAVLGGVPAQRSCVAIMGDSIFNQGLATNGLYDVNADWGFGTNWGVNVPHVNVAMSGDTFTNIIQNANHYLRWIPIKECNVWLSDYGINDISFYSYQQVSNNAVQLWKLGKSLGIPVWQTTLTPHTFSSDGWTTLAGQDASAYENSITNFNAFVRAGGDGYLAGYCDLAGQFGTNYNGHYVWKTGMTVDGLHPDNISIIQVMTLFGNAFMPLVQTLSL